MADLSEHQLAGRARRGRNRPSSGSRRRTEGSGSSPIESESRSMAGIPQGQPAQHRRRRSERLRALARETALQRSRQGRHKTLQTARGRAKRQVDCAMPDAQHLHQSGAPTQRKTRAGPKGSKQVQPVRAIVRQGATASSKVQRSVTLARKRREYTSGEAVERTPLTAGQNDSSNIDRAERQPLDGKGQPGSSAGMPGTLRQVESSSSTFPCTPSQYESPWRLATELPASLSGTPSAQAMAPLSTVSVQATVKDALSIEPTSMDNGNKDSTAQDIEKDREVPAPPLGSKENPHPRRPKGKLIYKPKWRKDSAEEARFRLMYKKIFHRRREGGDAYQTMSIELPEKKRGPRWGKKTFLEVETRPEDDPSIPLKARVAKLKRDKVLRETGGIAPQPGHKDYKRYRMFCRGCEGYF